MTMVRITKPGNGGNITLSLPENQTREAVALGFDVAGVMVTREGNNLDFTFGDGAITKVTNFFVTEGKELPSFVLEDGTRVSSADVLKQLNEEMNLETAAGPASASNIAGSGAGEYADDAGSLLDGIDRLGSLAGGGDSLGTGAVFDGADQSFGQSSSFTIAASTSGGGGSSGDGGIFDGDDGPVGMPYSFRAVLYMHEYAEDTSKNVDDYAVNLPFFGKNNNPLDAADLGVISIDGAVAHAGSGTYDIAVTLPEGWNSQWVALSFDPVSGRLNITFNPAYTQELQNAMAEGDTLLDYLAVSVNGPDGRYDYNAQVVITPDAAFDSAAQNAFTDDEAYPAGKDVVAEYHSGKGDGGAQYVVTGSSGNDEFVFDQILGGGTSVYASRQADGTLTGATDRNEIYVNKGMLADAGENNLVDTSDGKVTITGATGTALSASGSGAANTINAGAGKIAVETITSNTIATGVLAEQGGSNTLTAENMEINVDSGETASRKAQAYGVVADAGDNVLRAAEDITITASGGYTSGSGFSPGSSGILARNGGSNQVEAEGAITISADGYYNYALLADGGSNELTAKEIAISSSGYNISAIRTNNGGSNILKADTITLAISDTNKGPGNTDRGTALYTAGADSSTTLEATGDITITGSIGNNYGTNTLRAGGDITINQGAVGTHGGETILEAENVTVNITSLNTNSGNYTTQSGIYSNDFIADTGKTVVTAKDTVKVSVTGGTYGGDQSAGLMVNGELEVNARKIDIETNGGQWAHSVRTSGGETTLNAEEINIKAINYNESFGVYSTTAGLNTLNADSVTIVAESTNGKAYGLYAESSWTSGGAYKGADSNVINASHVDISATGSSAGNSIALYARGGNWQGGASNTINGTDGDDLVRITGNITAGSNAKNVINTGEGNDVIVLDGGVSGTFTLNAGSDYDTLVLKGDNLSDFQNSYKTWLESASGVEGVESIHVHLNNTVANADVIAGTVEGWLAGDQNVTWSQGDTMYLNNYFNGTDSSANLGDLLDAYSLRDITTLDLTGGKQNDLSLDLDFLNETSDLTILGDVGDTIRLEGAAEDWMKAETGNADGTYTWTHADGASVNVDAGMTLMFINSVTGG